MAPIREVKPGTLLQLWTEDAFCGNIRRTTDLPSAALTMPFVNPQTGPFYVAGAAPGDTLALHFVDLSPARHFGASCTIPLFGGLTSTEQPLWELRNSFLRVARHSPGIRCNFSQGRLWQTSERLIIRTLDQHLKLIFC